MGDYRDLIVWTKARTFVSEVYRISRQFPEDEKFGITSQLRRSAVSITANIAEGSSRDSDKEFARFISISLASAAEVECLIIIASDLEFIDESTFEKLNQRIKEIQRMLASLRSRLYKDSKPKASG